MSTLTRLGDPSAHMWRWVTDGGELPELEFAAGYREIILEVKGDLAGESLAFKGGITAGDLPHLASTKFSPSLYRIPGVLFLQPVTAASGVTINVRGIL